MHVHIALKILNRNRTINIDAALHIANDLNQREVYSPLPPPPAFLSTLPPLPPRPPGVPPPRAKLPPGVPPPPRPNVAPPRFIPPLPPRPLGVPPSSFFILESAIPQLWEYLKWYNVGYLMERGARCHETSSPRWLHSKAGCGEEGRAAVTACACAEETSSELLMRRRDRILKRSWAQPTVDRGGHMHESFHCASILCSQAQTNKGPKQSHTMHAHCSLIRSHNLIFLGTLQFTKVDEFPVKV